MRRIPLLAALFLCAASARAQAPAQAFEAANALYEKGQLQQAVDAYEALAKTQESPALLYNLGNAYFKLNQPGSLGKAIANYERAFALKPRDGDIRHNLDFALRRAGESLVPAGMPGALFVLFHGLSDAELAALLYAGLWLACLLGAWYLLAESRRAALRPWLTAALVVLGVCGAWWTARAASGVDMPGVILVENAEVRNGPGENFSVSFKAPEGRRVMILDRREGWAEIGLPKEGLKGWISASAVERVR